MGKKGSWFSAVKKVLSSEQKNKKDQQTIKSKNKWLGKQKSSDDISLFEETSTVAVCAPAPPTPFEDVKSTEAANEQNEDAYSADLANAVDADAAVAAAAQADAEVVCLATVARYAGKSNEEISAIKLQTAFRGYLARRALRAVRGFVRLRSLIQGQSVKRQSISTLRCMQTLARVQSQIRARRIRMSEQNLALQRQLQQKREKEVEKLGILQTGERWDHSTRSKEQVRAKMQHKQEAAIRRERALAYASSHQKTCKNSTKSANPTLKDQNNPQWGWSWSWLERWMADRPWESRSAIDDLDLGTVKSATSHAKAYSRRDLNHVNEDSPAARKLSGTPTHRRSSSTPPSKALSTSSAGGKIRSSPSPKGNQQGGDDDSRSMFRARSERYRRHSIEGSSSIRDNESLASLPSVTSYLPRTESEKARSWLPSPKGLNGTPEKRSVGSSKKLSFAA